MDENKCSCDCGNCKSGHCKNGMIGGWCHGVGHHWLLRLLIGLAILAIVFKIGFKLGEFKGEFFGRHSYTNQRMMGPSYGMMSDYGTDYGDPMMPY